MNELADAENNTNTVCPNRDPLYIVIPITVIYSVIFLTGTVGNFGTCFVIARNKYMHTATNYYLFSLAVSDLLLLLFGLPVELYLTWCRYPYIFGESFCVMGGIAAETSANASIITITAFTVERYVAICHPLLSHTLSNLSRAVKLICVIWVVSLICAIPQALQFGLAYVDTPGGNLTANVTEYSICGPKHILFTYSFEISTFFFFVLPMMVISVLYILIGAQLRSSSQKSIHQKSFKAFRETSTRNSRSSRRGVIRMLVAVVLGFFICWGPFHAQRLLASYGDPDNHIIVTIFKVLTYVSGILYFVSATINPILYHILSNKFRTAFKNTLYHMCSQQCLIRGDHESACNCHSRVTLTELDNNYMEVTAAPRRRSRTIQKDQELVKITEPFPLHLNVSKIVDATETLRETPSPIKEEESHSPQHISQLLPNRGDEGGLTEICSKNNVEFLL